jgi:hypothetical protein
LFVCFCSAEIPSLLNLTPLMNPAEETMQLSYGTGLQEQQRVPRSPVELMPTNATKFVPISPAPTLPEMSTNSEQGQKRMSVLQLETNQHKNKKIKIVAATTTSRSAYHPTTAQILQAIQPLTVLPSSSVVNGRPIQNGVDTSTAHIKALTGANGPAVCLDAIEKALEESGSVIKPDGSVSSTASADGKHLSAEEKARQSRDRNRQHARNTRVRKKAYVEELKRTLNQLVEERDTVVHQHRMEQQGTMEQRDIRLRVIEDFLNLRGRNEADPNRWGLILEDGFCLRLPRADIPGVVCSSGGGNEDKIVVPATSSCHPYPLGTSKKSLTGVMSVMEDTSMVSSLLQSLGASLLSVSYQCDSDSFMMDNANVVVNWTATSSGAVTKVRDQMD